MTYAEKQKAQTLSTIPEIDTEVFSKKLLDAKLNYEKEIYHPVTQKVEPDTDRNSILTNDYTRFTEDIERQLKPVKVTFKPTVADLPTNPLEEFINDAQADGFTYENGVLTKHSHVAEHFNQKYMMETENGKVKITEVNLKYDFLQDLSDVIDVLLKAGLEPTAIQSVAETILENGIYKAFREVQE